MMEPKWGARKYRMRGSLDSTSRRSNRTQRQAGQDGIVEHAALLGRDSSRWFQSDRIYSTRSSISFGVKWEVRPC